MLQGNGLGRREQGSTGSLTQVFANPTGMRPKVGGTTFDWSTVAPLAADETLPDGTVIKAGTRRIRYGMFIARITADGPSKGYYGLYDSTANDGRQLRKRGECFFVNVTVLFEDDMSAFIAAFEGGTAFKARLCIADAAAPGYMTLAQVEALFPQLRFVDQNV